MLDEVYIHTSKRPFAARTSSPKEKA